MNNKVREYLLNCSSCRSRFKLEGLSDGSTSAVSDLDDMDDNDSNASFSEDGKLIKSEWPARSQEALHFWDIVSFYDFIVMIKTRNTDVKIVSFNVRNLTTCVLNKLISFDFVFIGGIKCDGSLRLYRQ